MQRHAIVCCPEAATTPARECPGGSFQHIVVFSGNTGLIRSSGSPMISMTPSNRPMKSSPRLLFLLRGGITSTRGSPRLVTSTGLPVLATSLITPRHLALNSPAAIFLSLPSSTTLAGVFLLAALGMYGNLQMTMVILTWSSGLLAHHHSPPLDAVLPFQHDPDCLGVCDVLLLQNACGQRVLVIRAEHGHGLLQDDGAVVEVGVHEVHRAAGDFHAIVEGLLLRLQSWKRRQQRRMDVEDAVGKLLHEPRRQQAHVSRKADKINFVLAQRGNDLAIMLFARLALRRDHQRGQPAPPR